MMRRWAHRDDQADEAVNAGAPAFAKIAAAGFA